MCFVYIRTFAWCKNDTVFSALAQGQCFNSQVSLVPVAQMSPSAHCQLACRRVCGSCAVAVTIACGMYWMCVLQEVSCKFGGPSWCACIKQDNEWNVFEQQVRSCSLIERAADTSLLLHRWQLWFTNSATQSKKQDRILWTATSWDECWRIRLHTHSVCLLDFVSTRGKR